MNFKHIGIIENDASHFRGFNTPPFRASFSIPKTTRLNTPTFRLGISVVFVILILVFIVLAFPLYQLYAFHGIEIQSFAVKKISLGSNLQFFVEGSGELYNPSLIPLTIKEIRYEAYVNNELMMNGTINGKTIPAKSAESFPFSQQIEWVPDINTALQITAGKNVTMTITTEADVSYFSLFTITRKKQATIDIGRIIRPVLEKQIAAISNTFGLFSS